MKLSSKYGASIYSAIRRYVARNQGACAVLFINPPEYQDGKGFVAELRRVETSPSFQAVFGNVAWPEQYTPSDPVGKLIPLGGRRMSSPSTLTLEDRNGVRHECIAEGFTQTYQVFVLICPPLRHSPPRRFWSLGLRQADS